MDHLCRLELLGGFRMSCNGREIVGWHSQRAKEILAFLALLPGPHFRQDVAAAIWPDSNCARQLLNVEIHHLARLDDLFKKILQGNKAQIWLRSDLLQIDVEEFQERLRIADESEIPEEHRQHLEKALSLYRGHLLPEFDTGWVLEHREAYTADMKRILKRTVSSARTASHKTDDTRAKTANVSLMNSMRQAQIERLLQTSEVQRSQGEYKRGFLSLKSRELDILACVEWELVQNVEPKILASDAIQQFWSNRRTARFVRHWFEEALEEGDRIALTPLPFARNALGGLCMYFADYPSARTHFAAAHALFRERNDLRRVGWTLCLQSWEAQCADDSERRLRYAEEARPIFRSLRNRIMVVCMLADSAWALTGLGRTQEAMRRWQEAIRRANALGEPKRACLYRFWYACCLAQLDCPAGISAHIEAGMKMAQEWDDKPLLYEGYLTQGFIAERRGDLSAATRYYFQALPPAFETANLNNFATLLRAHLRTALGLRLSRYITLPLASSPVLLTAHFISLAQRYGAEKTIRLTLDSSLPDYEISVYEEIEQRLKQELGTERYQQEFEAGQRLTPESIINRPLFE